MFIIKLLSLVFILGLAGGTAYIAYTDVPVKQETVTKVISNEGILNNE